MPAKKTAVLFRAFQPEQRAVFYSCFLLPACLLVAGCSSKKTELAWTVDFPVIGSQSSPRAADLNQDGILDIVIGAGQNEKQHAKQGIIALDGKTGQLLWQQESTDQVFGSPTFNDVTGDGIPDVFIGGRRPQFYAINGKDGALIWSYTYKYQDDPILKYAHYNFNNTVLVPDQNGDGIPDLLAINGGNPEAAPYSEADRYPAVLMIINSKTGDIIAADTMPDGKESYMAPLCFAQPGSQDLTVLFGTGGETISGNLYLCSLRDLLDQKLSNARVIASETGHGFIAPPTLADINGDGFYDIVAISHGSSIFAIDGKNLETLWQQKIPGTESSNSFAAGYFTDDDVPDFFTFVSKGEWPNSTGSLQIMLDGATGEIAYQDSLGCTGFSSPVVYDLNHDGRDEAIISINEFDCSTGFTGNAPRSMVNKLLAVNFKNNSIQLIDEAQGLKNIFTTPWIGDLDQDGYLDIVHFRYFHYQDLVSFLGMNARRISTNIRIRKPVIWGAYRGTNGDGIFRKDQ
ncbi:MAG TPA: PQQ-binding-like beta-propeller repeat protein [Flavilitoribacter sp.]|nr:PQQ-binding-like beta-propeller repeat protein [Flavilitoribacter sp.]